MARRFTQQEAQAKEPPSPEPTPLSRLLKLQPNRKRNTTNVGRHSLQNLGTKDDLRTMDSRESASSPSQNTTSAQSLLDMLRNPSVHLNSPKGSRNNPTPTQDDVSDAGGRAWHKHVVEPPPTEGGLAPAHKALGGGIALRESPSDDMGNYEIAFGGFSAVATGPKEPGQFNGEVELVHHANGNTTAFQWFVRNEAWIRIGIWKRDKAKIEGSLASDGLLDTDFEPDTLEWFKLAAFRREEFVQQTSRAQGDQLTFSEQPLDSAARGEGFGGFDAVQTGLADVTSTLESHTTNQQPLSDATKLAETCTNKTISAIRMDDPFISKSHPSYVENAYQKSDLPHLDELFQKLRLPRLNTATPHVFHNDCNKFQHGPDDFRSSPDKLRSATAALYSGANHLENDANNAQNDLRYPQNGINSVNNGDQVVSNPEFQSKPLGRLDASDNTSHIRGDMGSQQQRHKIDCTRSDSGFQEHDFVGFGEDATSLLRDRPIEQEQREPAGLLPPSTALDRNSSRGMSASTPGLIGWPLSSGEQCATIRDTPTLSADIRSLFPPGPTVANPFRGTSSLNAQAIPYTNARAARRELDDSESDITRANPNERFNLLMHLVQNGPGSAQRREPTKQDWKGAFFTDIANDDPDLVKPFHQLCGHADSQAYRNGLVPNMQQNGPSMNAQPLFGVHGDNPLNAPMNFDQFGNSAIYVRICEKLVEYAKDVRPSGNSDYFSRAWGRSRPGGHDKTSTALEAAWSQKPLGLPYPSPQVNNKPFNYPFSTRPFNEPLGELPFTPRQTDNKATVSQFPPSGSFEGYGTSSYMTRPIPFRTQKPNGMNDVLRSNMTGPGKARWE